MLLLVATAISAAQIYWHTFLDESENLYFGYLMSTGAVLYRDMFSHHFPFPYWWVALVTTVAGKSITAVRASLVAFQLFAFAVAMAVTSAPLAVGATALVWSLIGYLYYGNLLIAYTFKALALLVMVAGVLLGASSAPPRVRSSVAVGVFGAVAVLTDPTAVYVVAVIVGLAGWRFGWRHSFWMTLPLVAGGVATFGWMNVAGNVEEFWEHAVRFNREVYGIFGRRNASALTVVFPYDGILRQSLTGLKLLDARWWAWMPDTSLSLPGALHDRWVLTGLAFRLYVVLATVLLVRAKEWSRAIGVYGVAVLALALRGEEGFHSSTFVLIAILCGTAITSGELSSSTRYRWLRGSRILAGLGLCLLASAGAATLWQERRSLHYEANFRSYAALGSKVARWTCQQPSVRVSYWPSDLLVNWYADRQPVSKYAYVLPWTLGISRQDIEASMMRERSVVIVDLDGRVGPFENSNYLQDLLAMMRSEMVEIERGVFASKSLAQCQRDSDH